MVVQDTIYEGLEASLEHVLYYDRRVRYEFEELSQLLEEIARKPKNDCMVISDPSWIIDDYDVSRWVITLEGDVYLDRVAAFRENLLRRDDVIDAHVDGMRGGKIAIRLVTTGGIPMGPVEEALSELKESDVEIHNSGFTL